MISIARGPEPWPVAIPRVNTEDPPIPNAAPRLSPLGHQATSPNPTTRAPSHTTNSVSMATGPTNAITRSRTVVGREVGQQAPSRLAEGAGHGALGA